jgi:transposase
MRFSVHTGLAVPNNITLVHQPPYAPELNPIENVWKYLCGNKLSKKIYKNYDDILEKKIAKHECSSPTTRSGSLQSPHANGARALPKSG